MAKNEVSLVGESYRESVPGVFEKSVSQLDSDHGVSRDFLRTVTSTKVFVDRADDF